jgi:hypothetical protein
MTTYQQKITFGEMRASGADGLTMSGSRHRTTFLTCTRCGKRSADMRPKFWLHRTVPAIQGGSAAVRLRPAPIGLQTLSP